MGNRLVLALVAAVAIVAVGGIGFAAFTSNAYIGASGSAGNIQLTWSNPATIYCSGYYNTYSAAVGPGYVTYPGDTLYLTDGALAPGDYCTFTASLNNIGTVPLTVTGGGLSSISSGCSEFVYGDNINGGSLGYSASAPGIGPSGSFAFQASIGLSSSAATQSASCTFSVTFTGTAA